MKAKKTKVVKEKVKAEKPKVLKNIEEDLYALIGQIDYGEISDIDTFWESLSGALRKLPVENWDGNSAEDGSVSTVLESLRKVMPDLIDEALIELTSDMEERSEADSRDSIDQENLEYLQSNIIEFEELFTKFLDKLAS